MLKDIFKNSRLVIQMCINQGLKIIKIFVEKRKTPEKMVSGSNLSSRQPSKRIESFPECRIHRKITIFEPKSGFDNQIENKTEF